MFSPVTDVNLFPCYFLRIEKLEKERTLSSQCRKNGWTDVCGELEEYEKVLEDERNADSKSVFASQYVYTRI